MAKKKILLVDDEPDFQKAIKVRLESNNYEVAIASSGEEALEKYAKENLLAVCGDITDEFMQEQVNLPKAKMIISTVPDFNDNLSLLSAIHRQTAHKKIKPKLIFMAQDEAETKILYERGVDYVISPHFMGGLHLAKILGGRDAGFGLKKLRESHLEILLNHEH